MRTITGFVAGFITALVLATFILKPTIETVIQTAEPSVIIEEVMTTIDLDRLRDVPPASDVDDQLNAECVHVIHRHTDEPMMGIMLYVERYWEGDACAALEHYYLHGWY